LRGLHVVLAAVLAASAMTVVSVTDSGAQSNGGRTLSFFESTKGSSFNFVDLPPKSAKNHVISVGDEALFSNPILDRRGGTRIGTAHAEGTFVKGRSASHALILGRAVFKLRGGEIVVEGLFHSTGGPHTDTAAVIGGTGAYEGARGQFISKQTANGAARDTVHLMP
jgi:hypothetical protein